MPPAVRIEAKAWDDPAFAVLAMRLGWQDADLAIIKCARVWAHATEQNDPAIAVVEVDAIVRTPGFAAHMVAARLADVSERNSEEIVLRGATGKNRNRISWLATKRKNSRKGGSANGAKWGAKGEPIGSGSAVPKGSPNTPAPAPAPASSQEPGGGGRPTPIDAIWSALNAARKRAIPGARDLRGSKSERARVSKLLSDGYTVADCMAVIANYEREVKADPTKAQWFDAVTPWRPENFSRQLARADGAVPNGKPPERPYNGRG